MTHATIEISNHVTVSGPAIIKAGAIVGVTSKGQRFFGKVLNTWEVVGSLE